MKRTSQCSDIDPRVQRRVSCYLSSFVTPRGRAYSVIQYSIKKLELRNKVKND